MEDSSAKHTLIDSKTEADETLRKVEDDEEEEEEEEEDKIIEKSHSGRFHKRNKRLPRQMEGVDNAFVAIEPKSGKEVIWNESFLPKQKTEKENRFLSVIKKLKKTSHPFLVRFLDAWITKGANDTRKMVFITERLDEGTLKQFLCNLSGSNKYWKRHISQLLSVIAHLHQMGVTHGLLTKENIYYQNSGSLKVGPFSLTDFFDQRKQPKDIYNLGLLALELAVWKLSPEFQDLPSSQRITEMISLLEDEKQADFVKGCLDPVANKRPRVIQLFNHPAVVEIPNLRLISAKQVVDNYCSGTTEEASTIFNRILKDNLSHFEDDNVLIESWIQHKEDEVSTRTWKDLKQNFSTTAKFLEHVRNGFYTLPWQPVMNTINMVIPPSLGHNALSTEDDFGIMGASQDNILQAQMNTCGLMGSTVNSTSNSRKNSNCIRSDFNYPFMPSSHHFPYTGIQSLNYQYSGIPSRDGSYQDLSPNKRGPYNHIYENTPSHYHPELMKPKIFHHSKHSIINNLMPEEDADQLEENNETNECESSLDPGLSQDLSSEYQNTSLNLQAPMEEAFIDFSDRPFYQYQHCELDNIAQYIARDEYHPNAMNDYPQTMIGTDPVNPTKLTYISNTEIADNFPDEEEDDLEDDNEYFDNYQSSISGNTVNTTGGQDPNNSDVMIINNNEKIDFVSPPKEFDSSPAVFSHCEYSYVGMGRWQLYVQVWFIEKKLKRDVFLQLFDQEWHDPLHVASLFELSKCLSSEDKEMLFKLLCLARHNCPLVEGNLNYPIIFTENRSMGNITFSDLLYPRLNALHLYQLKEELEGFSDCIDEDEDSKSTGCCHYASKRNLTKENSFEEDHQGCLEKMNKYLNIQTGSIGVLMNIGDLAPRNAACGFCDTHNYLHRTELPGYLTSPCYHCREALAKEAKITPEEFLDLHITKGIPWPSFFQARFNLPKDATNSMEELISYDCKWRSRQPCKCFISQTISSGVVLKPVDSVILPPCVEFDHLYDNKNCIDASNSGNSGGEEPLSSNSEDKYDTKSRHLLPCHGRHSRGARLQCPHGVLVPAALNRISNTNNFQPLHVQTVSSSVSKSILDLAQQPLCDPSTIPEDDGILNTPVDNNATATADNSKALFNNLSQI